MRDALAGVLCRCTGYTQDRRSGARGGRGRGRSRAGGRERQVGRQPRRPARRAGQGARRRAFRRRRLARRPGRRAGDARDPLAASARGVHARRRRRVPAPLARRRRRAHRRRRAEQRLRASLPTCATSRCWPTASHASAARRCCALVGDAETLLALPEAELPLAFAPRPAHETPAAAFAAAAAGEALHAALSRQRALPRPRRRGRRRGRARRSGRLGDARERELRDRATSSMPTSSRRRAGPRWSRATRGSPRRSASSPAPRRRTWTATRSPTCWRSRRSRCTSCPRRSAAASAASSTSRCSRLLAVAAWKLGRPVRLVYERPESMQSSTKRHPAQMTATASCGADGTLAAFDFSGDFNTGAYSSWGPTVANRVPIHATGPYRVPHVRALTRAVLTNNSVAGAFRGFGVPQAALLGELLIDELAAQCGIDPLEFRHRNALRAGDRTPTGQRLEASVGLRECLDALRPAWTAARAAAEAFNAEAVGGGRAASSRRRHRLHVVRHRQHGDRQSVDDARRAALRRRARRPSLPLQRRAGDRPGHRDDHAADVRRRGRPAARLRAPGDGRHRPHRRCRQVVGVAPDLRLGQRGAGGRAGTARGILLERLDLPAPTTPRSASALDGSALVGISGGTTAPRRPARLAGRCRRRPRRRPAATSIRRPCRSTPTARACPTRPTASRAQIAELEVDLELGTVRLLHIHAAHDVGRAINPTLVEGQVHGGIAQGIGMALMEEYVNGRTDNLHDYLIPTVGDVPPITVHLIEDPEPLGPWGAKGVGEPALVADGAGDPQRDPCRHRRAHARGAGDAEPRCAPRSCRLPLPLAGGGVRRGVDDDPQPDPPAARGVRAALRRPAGRARAFARAGADGGRQGALRGLPGALPDQPGQARRLRPLRQRRRRADAHRHAGARRQAGHRPGRLAGGARRAAAGTAASSPTRRVFVSGIGSTTTYPDYKPAPFIVASKHEGVDMVTVVTEGIFSYCSFKVKIDTDRYLGPEQATVRHRGEAVGHVSTIEYGSQFLALGGVHHLTGGSKKEGRRRLRHDDGARQPRAGRAADRGRRLGGRRRRQAAGRRRRRGEADARRLRLGDDRHLRAAVVRPGRRGGGGRRPHHRRALRAPGRQVPRHGAERHPPARPQVDAGPLLPGRQPGLGLGRHRHHRPARDRRRLGREARRPARACAC